ncbi:MAG: YggS family pyridoxal phosphate-dependent enzyme [Clostridia bacterium]|nr:YggS family pyridoxal phosphate-dependent enzyme [Clostridia bacterium]
MEKSLECLDERKRRVEENYKRILEEIDAAAQRSGRRAEDIELVAVTKTVPVEIINHSIELGVRHIGENRVQELYSKYDSLTMRDELKISVIGHLQTNKVRRALSMAQMIQSVDSLRLASEISRICVETGVSCETLVEINIGDEESKTGIEIAQAQELVYQMSEMPGIKVVGLMTIPPIEEKISVTRRYFEKIHKLFIDIGGKKTHNGNIEMKYLSMGMSSDFAEAIEEGSNMVRIGSALYGGRV